MNVRKSTDLLERRLPIALACAAFGVLIAASSAALAPPATEPLAACVPDVIEPVPDAEAVAEPPAEALGPRQVHVARYLARRFQIASESTEQMVGAAWRAATDVGLDPLLVLAVISVESRFNPLAESANGAKGLMQIIPRFHRDKFEAMGGEQTVLDPEANIAVGAQILKEYVRRTGTVEGGLQQYVGSSADGSTQYAQKVMSERERLETVWRASRGT